MDALIAPLIKLLEFFKTVRPGVWLLWVATILMAGGAFGSLGVVSVVPGNELYVLGSGIFVACVGVWLVWGRAKAEDEAKKELEGR